VPKSDVNVPGAQSDSGNNRGDLLRPAASSDAVRRRMQSTPRRDTRPEVELLSQLHRLGLRYRVDTSPLPGSRGRADIVFKGPKLAVYVDGCFWHGCPIHGKVPKTNALWWNEKIEKNKLRDERASQELRRSGWRVVRVWEHENPADAAKRIAKRINTIQSRSRD